MTYVITGATSFIGIALAQYLLNNGERVIAVCRPQSKGMTSLPNGVEIVLAEMAEYDHLHQVIPSADVFVNLAWGGTNHDGRDAVEVQRKNVIYSTAALFAADRLDCKVFLEAGSQAEYGETTNPQREDMECKPFSEYGRAKLEFKNQAFQIVERISASRAEIGEAPLKYIHLRIFSLFGETDHPWTLVMNCVEKMLKNEPIALSPCTQNWNFLYVNDAVRKIVALVEYAIAQKDYRHEVYNIASGDTRVLREYVKRIKDLTGSTSELLFGSIMPEHLVSLQPDMTKLEQAIGKMSETMFDDVIRKIIRRYK